MKAGLCLLLLLGFVCMAAAQDNRAADSGGLNGEQLFNQWMNRLNALDDWFITMDGKEEPEPVVARLLELYAPDAIQFVGPNEKQIGLVTLAGLEAIHKWADEMARTRRQIAWRLVSRTLDEKTAAVVATPAPWGGYSVAAEVTYAFTDRFSDRRFQIPGMVLLDFGDTGKIRRARLYMVKDEEEEILRYELLGN